MPQTPTQQARALARGEAAAGCGECKHRAVTVVPGTQRQVIARYKAAWDTCYKCAVTLRRENAKLEGLIVAFNNERIDSDGTAEAFENLVAEAARIAKRKEEK